MPPASSTTALLDADQLMAALPLCAAITVAARSVFGMRTVGVFAPALLALAVVHLGLRSGLGVLAAGVLAGAVSIPVVHRLALPRIARVSLVLCAVCAGVQVLGFGSGEQGALPVVVLAVVIERGWDAVAGDGWQSGVRIVGSTLLLAGLITALLTTAPIARFLSAGGLAPVAVGAAAIVAAGSYRGLRLQERRRFRGLLQLSGA